jgi:hypothetical protein
MFRAFKSAPLAMRTFVIGKSPFSAAACKGVVSPVAGSIAFTLAPLAMRTLHIALWPVLDATTNPHPSVIFALAA